MNEHNQNYDKILGLLLMRFQVNPSNAVKMIENWLNEHPNQDNFILESYFKNYLVTVENNELINLYDDKIMTLVNDFRGSDGVEIKDRRYRLTTYPLCFIGSEAVEWMRNKYLITKSDAIKLGQQLIDLKLIHHVVDEHNFEDAYFFYRFYLDEM